MVFKAQKKRTLYFNLVYMTMSFMPLLVILKLKVTDKALFNPDEFQFIDLELAISIECLRSSMF